MENKWTDAQQAVIDSRDKNILVSAAAGSGKTAVLVERIINMITDENRPIDVDKLLVVTFTNAAAGEMKERILGAIEKKSQENPKNEHLQRQLTYIHNANICTIHSFCLNVIRDNYIDIDIDPSFAIGDDGELKLLRGDVVKEVMETYYREKSVDFISFIEQYSQARSDANIEDMILKLYNFSMSYPNPQEWLKSCEDAYNMSTKSELEQASWMKKVNKDINEIINNSILKIERAYELTQEADGPDMYADAIRADMEFLKHLKQLEHFDDKRSFINTYKAVALGRKASNDVDEVSKAMAKSMRDEVKKNIALLNKNYFLTGLDEQLECIISCRRTISVLVNLTNDFAQLYSERKKEKNIVDFGDLEHMALSILTRTDENGKVFPTRVADELAMQFVEVMVDEYQDSNYVQETLVNAVSCKRFGRNNTFMVGDVKQSIYKFRLARPEIFIQKYLTYIPIRNNDENKSKNDGNILINLDKNFRSRREVLSATNFIFTQIMGQDIGGIEYDDNAKLYYGADYEAPPKGQNNRAELMIINSKLQGEDEDQLTDISSKEMEAYAIADRISEMMGKFMVFDRTTNSYRNVKYSDIVILLRSTANTAEIYSEILNNEGIPAYCENQTGYFDAMEVATILNMLRVIDNPRQDIPLVSVLTSPMFGVTNDELALIRSECPKDDFYEAVKKHSDNKKINRFLASLKKYRECVSYMSIYELITYILEDTGYYSHIMTMPGGRRRRANLEMLKEKAIDFENGTYSGLFNFVRYIEKLEKYEIDAGEASVVSDSDNTVKIMTIHKSKGLEFPVVFVAAMGKQFNKMDSQDKMCIHSEMGIGINCIRQDTRIKINTLIKKAVATTMQNEDLGEELRVLYVALTRAREKLILVGNVKNFEKTLIKWTNSRYCNKELLSTEIIKSSQNYLDLVGYALSRNKCMFQWYKDFNIPTPWQKDITGEDSGIDVSVKYAENILMGRVEHEIEDALFISKADMLRKVNCKKVYNDSVKKEIERRTTFSYPYETVENIPAKVSVSALKEKHMEELEEQRGLELFQPVKESYVPAFLAGKTKLTGAGRGTAFHRVLELFDYSVEPSVDNYRQMIQKLLENGRIDKDSADCIDYNKLVDFAASDVGRRMKKASLNGTLKREAKFVMGVSASQIDKEYNDSENVLVQGIIDAYFEENGKIVLVDYKTDRVSSMSELTDRYATQLECYAEAIQKITGYAVDEKIIYSIHLSKEEMV